MPRRKSLKQRTVRRPQGAAAAGQAAGGGQDVEVTLPELGESVMEGTITEWLVAVGDEVNEDDPLFELSSDKIDTEVPSPATGVLKEIKVDVDETVVVGTVVAIIGAPDDEHVGRAAVSTGDSGVQTDVAAVEQPTTETRPSSAKSSGPSTPVANPDGPIFIVHGHDHARLHHVIRILERTTSRDVVVLHEQANRGMTLLEKFERHSAQASFAVILLTGDDQGQSVKEGTARPRARQNVVLELGFFFGKLGRDRVAVLAEPGVERPSDLHGLVYISLDDRDTWKLELARELATADIDVDYARMP